MGGHREVGSGVRELSGSLKCLRLSRYFLNLCSNRALSLPTTPVRLPPPPPSTMVGDSCGVVSFESLVFYPC